MFTIFRRSTRMQTGLATIAAAGTVQGDATALSSGTAIRFNVTGGDGTKGVILPALAATTGAVIEIFNNAASALKVYPATGGKINGGSANAAVLVGAYGFGYFGGLNTAENWAAVGADIGGDYATLAGTETLTNKTLTSPTIDTGTINSPTVNNALTLETGTAAAAGTVQGDATALSGSIAYDITAADAAKGVALPAAVAGLQVLIYNNSVSPLFVYPATGDDINDGTANASITILGKRSVRFSALDATTWAATQVEAAAQTVNPAADSGAGSTILPHITKVAVGAVVNDADDWIVLPAIANLPIGHQIIIACNAGGNFEMRTPASSNTKINDVDSDGTQEYLCTDTDLIIVTKHTTTGWVGQSLTKLGAVRTAVVPD